MNHRHPPPGARRWAGSRWILLVVSLVGAISAGGEPLTLVEGNQLVADGKGWRANGDDPWLLFDLPSPASPEHEIRIEMRTETEGATLGQLFCRATPDQPFTEEHSIKFAVASGGTWHRYRLSPIDCGGDPAKQVRLDPFQGGGTIELRSVRLVAPERTRDGFEWHDEELTREWIPGPGLQWIEGSRYRVTGGGAWLAAPSALRFQARRFPQCEVRLRSAAGEFQGRLCFGIGGDCAPVPVVNPQGRNQYLHLMAHPAWRGEIRGLRLEPLGPAPPVGTEVELKWFKVVPFQADPVASRVIDLVQDLRPYRPAHIFAGGLAVLLAISGIAAGAARRGSESGRRALASIHLVSVVAIPCLLAAFPFEPFHWISIPLGPSNLDIPTLVVYFALAVGLLRRFLVFPTPSSLPAIERPAIVFVAVLAASTALGNQPWSSLGYLERHLLPVVAALLAASWAPVGRRAFRPVLGTVLTITTFLGGLGIVQALGAKDVLYGAIFKSFQPIFYHANLRPRPFATIGHPVPLATILLALIPICLYVAVRDRSRFRWFGVLAAAVGSLCFLLTISRGAYLAAAVAAPLLVLVPPRKARPWVVVGLVGLALLASGILYARRPQGAVQAFGTGGVIPPPKEERARWEANAGRRVFIAQRILGARIAAAMVKEHPVLGHGLGQLRAQYDDYVPPGTLKMNPVWSTADNSYLTLLAETGLMGLAGWLLVLGASGRVLFLIWRGRSDGDDGPLGLALLGSLVGVSVHLAIYDGLYWFTPAVFTSSVLGLGLAALDHMGRSRVADACDI